MKYVSILLMICLGSCTQNNKPSANEVKTSESSSPKNYLNFQEYWSRFRESVLKQDTIHLEEFCHFPLVIKGDQDDEPVVKINKNNFSACFALFLKREVYKKGEHLTNFNFIKLTINPKESFGYQETENWLRVGDLEFEVVNNAWVLTLFYYPKDILIKEIPSVID